MNISDGIAIAELIVAFIGIIVGIIGGKELRAANEIKVQFRDLKTKIEKIELNNSQVANTINNNGIGVKDTEYLVKKVVDDKIEELPKVHYGYEEPGNSMGKDGDIYLKIEK